MERVPPAVLGSILLGRAGGKRKQENQHKAGLVLILLALFHQLMDFAVAFVGFGAVGTIVPLFDGVVALIELIGYCGDNTQRHDHPYAYNYKTHLSLFTFHSSLFTSTPIPADLRSFQN